MSCDLWSFATHVYAAPGVEAACLRLQERGADVCLLLTALWLEQRGCSCSVTRLGELHGLANPWQARVVWPLRQLRQAWKAGAAEDQALAGLREQVRGLEQAAERQLLERLQRVTAGWAAEGHSSWLEAVAGSAARGDCAALATLRRAAGLA